MKALTTMTAIAAMLGVWTTASKALAQTPDLTVNISLTATVQGDTTEGDTTTSTARPSRVRLNNKDILNLVATDHGTNYAPGSKIVLLGDDDTFVVEDRQGNILDSIPELTFTEGDHPVTSGKIRNDDNSGTQTVMQLVTLSFDDSAESDNPIVISASGILTGHSTISRLNKNDEQRLNASGSARLAGDGTVGGANAVVSGNLHGSGRGTFTAAP
ncbi:MAG TPA: hypothetical protein VHH88_12815 [Verrucomicrobiae bacterium]|nr:hypothetical protein [Verrucomicrobiae bacterium]